MTDYNNDSYSYNHIIRGYEHTWPGKKEPAYRKGKIDPWHVVCILLLIYNFLNMLCKM